MRETITILNDAAQYCGLSRIRFNNANVPRDPAEITAVFLPADFRSLSLASSLLKVVRSQSKYAVLCSWPGYQSLFPYFDEYWEINPELSKTLFCKSSGFATADSKMDKICRGLHYFFSNVINGDDVTDYYRNGFTNKFGQSKLYLPAVPSGQMLGKEILRSICLNKSVYLRPSTHLFEWKNNAHIQEPVNRLFWSSLIRYLLNTGFKPIVGHGLGCYDMSGEFTNDCIFLGTSSVDSTMAAMQTAGRVVDFFGGVARLAVLARAPFVAFDEYSRYSQSGDQNLDGTLLKELIKKYIFLSPTIIRHGEPFRWEEGVFAPLIDNLEDISITTTTAKTISTAESEEIIHLSVGPSVKSIRTGMRIIKPK